MRLTRLFSVIFVAGFLALSCKSPYEALLRSPDVQTVFDGAMDYYNQGKYLKAATLFDKLLMAVNGTEKDDTVQFYNALSNYRYGDISTAEAQFEKFFQTFPRSPFTEEAKFLRIECLYQSTYRPELDQMPTHKAMAAINEYLYEHPNNKNLKRCRDMLVDLQDRLDRKSFEAARLYYTIEDYRAASYALKNTLKENAENKYREDIMYYIVAANYMYASNSVKARQKERFLTLIDEYYNFISEFPDSRYRKELDSMFAKAQQYINK
ncbi:MAG: outer membrane protein assembly factor BamD [Bacteroidales bacterium]|nr:outer membrane protein assembly factor BamD [Bacteroidales bacterium]MDD3988836.1 outer membrane protein assembly factor BamD [Bacteroidales bacterium]MDD4639096.1 outer membrane protein assembly factor BamD [Bacteroidales bacterium]